MRKLFEILASLRVFVDAASSRLVDAASSPRLNGFLPPCSDAKGISRLRASLPLFSRPVDAAASPRPRRTFLPFLTRRDVASTGFAAAFILLFSFAALPAFANTLYDNITVTGGTATPVGDDEVLITYADPTTPGTLTFIKGSASARVLAVGGGGGGGSVNNNVNGAGGGGGGGGVVDINSPVRFKGTYTITVGAGGTAATARSVAAGGMGGNSTIVKDDVQAEGIPVAKGGGGGGGGGSASSTTGPGQDGGSGGGGSAKKNGTTTITAQGGGKGESGQGHDGGAGNHRYVGAGGGGAGAAANDTTSTSAGATAGGSGVASTIRGLTDDCFGGGGAGGDVRASGQSGVIAGSLGGGGSGGSGDNKESRDGENGRGGGGGGNGGYTATSWIKPGVGGSGIVIIRLSNYQEGGVPLPSIPKFVYNKKPQTVATETANYTLSGDVTKTDVGTYHVTFTLTEEGKKIGWDEDLHIIGDSTNVEWSISMKEIAKPAKTKESFVFDGSVQRGFVEDDDWYAVDEKNNQRDADTYSVTATLKDVVNTKWADLAAGVAERKDLTWTITKKQVSKPTRVAPGAGYPYDGDEHQGYAEGTDWSFSTDGLNINKATNAAVYTPRATLTDPKNTQWADVSGTTRSDLEWKIVTKEVSKPPFTASFTFDNTEKTCAEPAEAYEIKGNKATNAGEYTFTATLNNPAGFTNYKWKNGTAEPYSDNWTIQKRTVVWTEPTKEYIYQKGTVREPVPASEWYVVTGGSAEEVGTYSCVVHLMYNDSQVNVTWDDATTADKAFDWKITAQEVPLPVISDFTYEESPKGTPVPHTVLTIAADALYEQASGDALTQDQADDYAFSLRLKDTHNYVWKTDPVTSADQEFDWSIRKADNEIYGVTLEDWQYGDKTPRTPSCTDVKFGNKTSVKYAWSTSAQGPDWAPWDNATRPVEAGTYYLRASTPATDNWNATNVVKRFCVWTNPAEVFTDFMDISIDGVSADTSSGRTDGYTTVLVKLREPVGGSGAITDGFPGFEYARAGGTQPSELRFVLTNAVKLADKLLPFTNVVWNSSGVSQLRVRVPKATGAVKTIRMYWHTTDGDPQSDNYPEDVGPAGTFTANTFSLVNREGTWIDYWTSLPTITKTIWQADEPPPTEDDITNGSLKDGTVSRIFLTMPRGVTNETIQTAPGTYEIVFNRKETPGASYALYGGEKRLQYDIIWHNTYENLGGTVGGRILLGNNDTMSGHEITGQAYWQTDPAGGTYWTHDTLATPILMPNIGIGANHVLYGTAAGDTYVLWRLVSMRTGSLYRNNKSSVANNYLPWSTTCQPRTATATEISPDEVTYLILRNTEDAALYSSCYSNGIGTVYFDMVNGWVDDQLSQVIVEVATQTSQGKEPTDENCAKGDSPFYWLTHNAQGEDLSEAEDMWLPVKPTVLIKQAGSSEFVTDTAQKKLSQCLIEPRIMTGGGTETFYRICASTNYAKHCRFRIRRKGEISGGADSSNLVLLDNVIVSPPAMSAYLDSPGTSDATSGRIGKQTLGQAGALSTAFPAMTDTGVKGRAKVHFVTTPGIDCDLTTFIASARFNYRWRYLNQIYGDWKTIYLDHTEMVGREGEIIPTVESVDFTGRAGDVEWYYDLTLHAPAYKYVDYSGCGVEKPVDGYNEEVQTVTNHQVLASGATRQASGGTDWFVRLREGQSNWEGMKVVIKSDDVRAARMVGEYPMELVSDNMWRAMVVVPTNAEGTCTFQFLANNLHEGGDPDHVTTEWTTFGGKQTAAVEIPNSGPLAEGVIEIPFVIDHAAGYLEFKMSDKFLTYQVGRAEYQDFNSWNDAHTPATHQWFRADSTDSNSVNVADMKTERADIASWKPFAATNDAWTEAFVLTDYSAEDPEWEREILRPSCETPKRGGWTAQNITFVAERLVTADPLDQAKNAGMSGKLLGSGSGVLTFAGTTQSPPPQGLEKVTLKARLGQTYTFDSFTYSKESYLWDNYMFFAPVTMSHRTKNDDTQEVADMAVGASASMIAYYSPETGCYEFRAERLYTNLKGSAGKPTVRLSVYKWYVDGFVWTNRRLCYRDFDDQALWSYEYDNAKGEWNPEADRKFYGMFISLSTDYVGDDPTQPRSTTIVCALSDAHKTDHTESWKNFSNEPGSETATYRGLTFTDTENPYGWGSYGVGSKDCPAQFVMPAHTASGSPFSGTFTEKENKLPSAADKGKEGGEGGKYFSGETFQLLAVGQEFVQDRNKLNNRRYWATIPGRCECFTNAASGWNNWIGLRTPTNLVQNLELYLKPQGSGISQWQRFGGTAVTGYGFKQLPAYDVKRTGQWDMELRTGEALAIDVVVDDVCQYRWQAPDINDPQTIVVDDRSTIFVYSQSLVLTNTAEKTQYVRLQPARASASRPVSMRSPILGGLGKFTFSYRDVEEHAELWLQVATNRVSGNLDGTGHYNESIVSKELGEQQEIGEWLTVKKYARTAKAGYEALGESGSKTEYLGWHNHPDRPLKGLFRLFVPPAVVSQAIVAATNATKNVDYGALTVTAASCTDEPGMSDRSWRGWNMRTVGDPGDSEKRMNLVDMVTDEDGGNGLVCALNNSWNNVEDNKGNVVDGKDPKVKDWHPTVYSPTMKPLKKDRGVGSVSVKARLYATNDRPVTDGAGRIVVWGARDSRATDWKVLCTNLVTSSVFSNFTWSAGKDVYTAVKFEVTESAAAGETPTVDRVILDEIVIGEKVPPTINFLYARPFRMNLFSKEPIADILSPSEQPLAGESWGVQTQLSLQQLTDEIDVEKGFEVQLSYFRGETPWGYAQWCKEKSAVDAIPLLQVGDKSNLVFRSYGDAPESLVAPSAQGGEIVQFMLTVKYWDRGGKSDTMRLSSWEQPSWFYPLDKNAWYGGDEDENRFSAYTVLDTVSPGRAWINEVNWNDGPMTENGGNLPVTNQFIELCVPANVDLTGWYVRVTDPQLNQHLLANLGDKSAGIPSAKAPTANCTNGYEFLVLQSPQSTIPQADAKWYAFDLGSDIRGGTLPYNDPLQFELVRPSGVIEHQFVMDGTNEYSKWSWGTEYDGTNLVRKLNDADLDEPPYIQSPKRFWARRELSRAGAPPTLASTGVVGGEESEDMSRWPGGSETWQEGMAFTPGRINVGQTIPKDWMILPNGTNSWVYFTAGDGRIRQKVGQETNAVILVVVPQGKTTNVTYEVDNWYEAVISETGKEPVVGGRGSFRYSLTPTGMVNVVATTQPQGDLAARYGLTADNPYTPSILRWLTEEYGKYNVEDIRLGRFRGLNDTDRVEWLTLNDMYWLDIPPVPQTPEERAMNDGTNWWLRAGITKMGVDHVIERQEGLRTVTYTNKQLEVKMYVTNACTTDVWAPGKLRGLDYKSSDDFAGVWTSVTFKVCGRLDLSTATEFLPFRTFTFYGGSFTGPAGAPTMDPPLGPYSSRIDILDPFQSAIGRSYGWDKHPNTQAYFLWKIDTDFYPYTIEMLKADATYKGDGE